MVDFLFRSNNISDWMSQIEVLFAAIFFIFVIVMLVVSKEKNKQQMYLYGIVFSIAMLLFSDVLVAAFYEVEGRFARVVEVVGNPVYYFSNYTTAWLIICYSSHLIEEGNGKVPKVLQFSSNFIYMGSGLMLILNAVIPYIFYIDENNVYQRGQFFLLSLIPVAFMLILLFFILIKGRNNLSKYHFLIILSYVFIPLAAEVFQIMDSEFAWQPLAMTLFGFIIIIQNVTSADRHGKNGLKTSINNEGKNLQARIILFVCIAIVIFFSVIARIAIDLASTQINQEIEAHYQMLSNKTTEQASAWIVKETQILLNQKASLEIINNFDNEFLTEYFTYIVNDYNYDRYLYDIYFVNTKNQMSAGSGYVQDPDIDFRERNWYSGALSSDNMCYTVPYRDVDTGNYVVTVSIKVFDRSRRFVGVLALDIFVDRLFDITDQQSLPKDSYLFIVDNNMGIVTHPNEKFGYIDEAPQNIRELGSVEYNELADFILNNKDEQAYYSNKDYDGNDRCFFVSKVDDCDWYVVAAISQKVIEESRSNMSKSIFIALIVCLILGIILSLWATNSIIRKLTEAQEEAKAASEAKSKFLANMSHEIRTPINAVLGMDEILIRECKDDSLLEYARNIQSAGQALLGVVNDILDFSKIESDRLDLVSGNYVLGELIVSCVNLIVLKAQEKALLFNVERDDYLPKMLYGDEVRVRQIISNLLTNAVKYTNEGSITLFVGWSQIDKNKGELIIRVTDTGIGIKNENIEDLFTSFKRLDENKNRNIEGTGLGLSITKQLVELMNGSINVESEYGHGSEFSVKIPQNIIDADNTDSLDSLHALKGKEEETVLYTKDARILVVDDVFMNIQVVKGLLKRTGLIIDTAERGREALMLMEKNKYDLVFLDDMMPGLNGVETFSILKVENPEVYKNTPIVMLTANTVLGVEEKYKSEGFADYLSKPVDREMLYKCLIKHLPKEKIIDNEIVEEKTAKISSDIKPGQEDKFDIIKDKIPEYDLEKALKYCNGDKEFLVELLKEYCNSKFDEKLIEAFEKKDIENYRIKVHSLKSTSLMLGFVNISEEAKALEMATKENRWEYVEEHHQNEVDMYQYAVSILEIVLGQ